MSGAQVYINKEIFTRWKQISIKKSLDSISGSFSMTALYNYAEEDSPFVLSGLIEIFHPLPNSEQNIKIMTGYIDVVNTSVTQEGLNVELSGRDITCDPIDCSVDGTKEWSGIKAIEVIDELLCPFSLKAKTNTEKTDKLIERQNAKPDSKVADILASIAKKAGVIMITDEDGVLNLVSKADSSLSSGVTLGKRGNILSMNHTADYTKRFSKITVLENSDSDLSDLSTGGGSSAIDGVTVDPTMSADFISQADKDKATAEIFSLKSDNEIKTAEVFAEIRRELLGIKLNTEKIGRFRPLTVVSSGNSKNDSGYLEKESKWRMALSRASVIGVNVKVQGWLNEDDELWKINKLIPCDLERVGLDKGEMLIKSLSFNIADDGSYTDMELIYKDAYDDTEFELSDDDKASDISLLSAN